MPCANKHHKTNQNNHLTQYTNALKNTAIAKKKKKKKNKLQAIET
jgi:hypothetical protein